MLQNFDAQKFFENAYTVVEIDDGFGVLNVIEDAINQQDGHNNGTVYVAKLELISNDTAKTNDCQVYNIGEAYDIMDQYVQQRINTSIANNPAVYARLVEWQRKHKIGLQMSAWAKEQA